MTWFPCRLACVLSLLLLASMACGPKAPADRVRVSGEVETTDVQVSPEVGGRLLELHVDEGDRVKPGDLVAKLDTADTELTIARARADREQAAAQLRLAQAGARAEDIRQAEAELANTESNVGAAQADLTSAEADVQRFEALLASNSGSRKQRDDAVTKRNVAQERLQGAQDQARAAREALSRLLAGSRPEEVQVARARVASADAQIATLQKALADATITAPVGGIVTEKVADVGELLQPHAPIVVISDLDRAWANVYVDEPVVPRLRVGQGATLFTDAGGSSIPGIVSYISPKAEFTPGNVQTAEERSKLVYRIKVSADNRGGVLKAGMPVEAEIPLGH